MSIIRGMSLITNFDTLSLSRRQTKQKTLSIRGNLIKKELVLARNILSFFDDNAFKELQTNIINSFKK